MKYFLVILLAITFISCQEEEIVYDYPDGISKPDNIIESKGCGNIFVYQFLDSLRALTVWINSSEYNLTKKRQDIDLDISNQNVSVVLEISPDHPDSIYFNFCNDIAYINEGTTIKYKAASGRLSFSVSEDNPLKEPAWKIFYYVTIRIENLHLVNPETNDEIIIEEAVFWNVAAGWMIG
jgi:hypothetical protein